MTKESTVRKRLDWLVRVYSADADALTNDAAAEHVVEMPEMYGLDHFLESYRPLSKLREARGGEAVFTLGEFHMPEPDRVVADLVLDGDIVFEAVVRVEDSAPHRIHYWVSHKPLPAGITIRPYVSTDEAGCVALEQVCPMEMLNGDRWVIDRTHCFNDCLALMEGVDAAVALDENERVIGFYSCALRPVAYQGEDAFCIYQHHYRVHPDHREGSVSQALASYVDPRRTFEAQDVRFPYSMIDSNNAHMQHVGFPSVPDVVFARLSIPMADLARGHPLETRPLDIDRAIDLINSTHHGRTFFLPYDRDVLNQRLSRIEAYGERSFVASDRAIAGVWQAGERNMLDRGDAHSEITLSFLLDYGCESPEDLVALLRSLANTIRTTHIAVLLDTRAEEYAALRALADDEQRLTVHTLPWIVPDFQRDTVYCDGIYC